MAPDANAPTALDHEPSHQEQISIIIPTLNEANTLPTTLQRLQTLGPDGPVEVIVADGGSTDDTLAIAQSQGVQVITVPGGRGQQMNHGATLATGDTLLFLHADTVLPPEFDHLIQQTLAQPGVVAGAFDLAIDDPAWGLRWVEWGVRQRSRWLQLPYGDQALFLRAAVFRELGGYADLPIMEDFDLVQRLKLRGKIAIAPAAVLTSGRRWQKLGVWRTTLANQVMVMGYFGGIDRTRLAQWYRQLGRSR